MLKDNLILLRRIHGFSQEELSEKIGISRQAYAKWESGATIPDIEKCSRLAGLYGIAIDDLLKTEQLEGIGQIPPAPRGKNIWGTITVKERGQIIIPKAARERFHLQSGQRLIVLSDEEGIVLMPAERFEEKMRLVMESASRQIEEK